MSWNGNESPLSKSPLPSQFPASIQGISSSAFSGWLARRFQEELARSPQNNQRLPFTWVVCAPSDEKAEALRQDFETFLESFNVSTTLEQGAYAVSLPTFSATVYSSIQPAASLRHQRIAALVQLHRKQLRVPTVVFTTGVALMQRTLSRDLLQSSLIGVQLGNPVGPPGLLARRLSEIGYLHCDPVEDPGTFCSRGDLLDIFVPGDNFPIRIEFFDDVVERIRHFDPSTQRTFRDLSGIELGPSREVFLTAETQTRLRTEIKRHSDNLSIHRAVRDPILDSLSHGYQPDRLDTWAPFAFATAPRTFDLLPDDTHCFWFDRRGISQSLVDSREDSLKRFSLLSPEHQVIPSPEDLFDFGGISFESGTKVDSLELATTQLPPDANSGSASNPRVNLDWKTRVDLHTHLKGHPNLSEIRKAFLEWHHSQFKIQLFGSTQSQHDQQRRILEELGLPTEWARPGTIQQGFVWPELKWVVLNESDLFGTRQRPPTRKKKTSISHEWSGLQALSDLEVGDLVIHVEHGVARYLGLQRLGDEAASPSVAKPAIKQEFLVLEFAGRDRLYVPVYRLNQVQKYVTAGRAANLDRLGQQNFEKTKQKVRDSLKRLAIDLVTLYAERKLRPGQVFSRHDATFSEFEARFPYEETPDQLKAIGEVLEDLSSGRVMDRLVCGDVGYGKTEVAMRAAFRVASEGKQVAILCPTTLLARQHEATFRARFSESAISIDSISRLKNTKEIESSLRALQQGGLDILVGTHRILSKDVCFKDLGLIIVDEEHRFGVEHKERLKALKTNTHVLTLTATPIPRTLHMALSGLRDISLIRTPPQDRLPIRTLVGSFEEALVAQAIRQELGRGGQVFFLHNRVETLTKVSETIKKWVPEALLSVAHGQMSEQEMESAMLSFYDGRANVLVCTTIIESGLDIPNANTILIDRADTLGLSQLYQIRGRVGRGQNRGFAYLLIPGESSSGKQQGITDDARRRLEVLQRFVNLGSGFNIATHDLEIRGGGDLLGPQQSGNIASVGLELYTELLEEAMAEIQSRERMVTTKSIPTKRIEPEIRSPFEALLPESYISSLQARLSIYRRFSSATHEAELDLLIEELKDRFGPLPVQVTNLLWTIRIKQFALTLSLTSVIIAKSSLSVGITQDSGVRPEQVLNWLADEPTRFKITPDSRLVIRGNFESLEKAYHELANLFTSRNGAARV